MATRKVGRPTKYTKALAAKLPGMFKEGESIAEVCAELDICKDTFYEWKDKYPEFSDAVKRGLELSEAWWCRLGRRGSAGQEMIQPTTWIFNMKNRFNWQDRQATEISGPSGKPIETNSNNKTELTITRLV